jgi:hypothetical protein
MVRRDLLPLGLFATSLILILETQSSPTMPTHGRSTRTFPPELVYDVILHAWLGTRDGVAKLYPALSLVSRRWRDTTLKIAWKHVICESEDDFQLYLALVVERAWLEHSDELLNTRRTRSGSSRVSTAMPSPKSGRRVAYVKTDADMDARIRLVVRALPLSPSLFRDSHIHVDPFSWKRCAITDPVSSLLRRGIWGRDVETREALERCKSYLFDDAKVLIMPFDPTSWSSNMGHKEVMWAHDLRSLTELVIHDAPYTFFPKILDPHWGLKRVERVAFSFRDHAKYLGDPPGQDPGWNSFGQMFPAATHLTLSNPSPLKHAVGRLPPRLRTLVLEAQGTKDGSTIEGWALPKAFMAGLLHREPGAGLAPVILIKSHTADPLGWPEALVAARAHGLRLEIEHVVAC